jgi:hypothetical protein
VNITHFSKTCELQLDKLGYVTFSRAKPELLFAVVNRTYERSILFLPCAH